MKILVPLLFMLFAMPALADRKFDIEVVIFKRAVDAKKTHESWPQDLPKIEFKNSGSLNDANYRSRKGVIMLPASEYKLNDQVAKLSQHAGFKVLMHKAWRQGDKSRYGAPSFHIKAGKDFSNRFNMDGSIRSIAAAMSSEGITEQSIPKPIPQLEGKLQIFVEHYLYADVELDLKAPGTRVLGFVHNELNDLDSQPSYSNQVTHVGLMEEITPSVNQEEFLQTFRMDQKRRMKSNETHYLDHPLMGVLIQVRRVKP
jgi:hypothetical protein